MDLTSVAQGNLRFAQKYTFNHISISHFQCLGFVVLLDPSLPPSCCLLKDSTSRDGLALRGSASRDGLRSPGSPLLCAAFLRCLLAVGTPAAFPVQASRSRRSFGSLQFSSRPWCLPRMSSLCRIACLRGSALRNAPSLSHPTVPAFLAPCGRTPAWLHSRCSASTRRIQLHMFNFSLFVSPRLTRHCVTLFFFFFFFEGTTELLITDLYPPIRCDMFDPRLSGRVFTLHSV